MNNRLPALLLGCCVPILGQVHVGAGLKAGTPLAAITEGFSSGGFIILNRTFWWTLGPTVEVDLPLRFGLEFDALYRRVGYDGAGGRELSGNVWDFPLLAKYRFTGGSVQPYVGGGWTYRRLGDLLRLPESSSNGGVVAAGLRIGSKSIKISPEFRYTHWPNQDIQPGFRTRKSQFEAMVGVTF